MKIRFHAPLVALALTSLASGEDAAALTRKGEQALAAGLWEIAADHFEHCLNTPGLKPDQKSQTALHLTESWIREGRFTEAIQLLDQSWVEKTPEAQFWRGQALVGLGQFNEAIATLSPLAASPESPNHPEAIFTLSNLHLALGKPEAALDALKALSKTTDGALAARTKFHEAEILLDLDRNDDARKSMPELDSLPPALQSRATFLEAHLALREGRPDEAVSGFQTLLDPNQPYHPAALGLVDAYLAMNARDLAVSFLLSFIQSHPDSPLLGGLFERLLVLLPAKPAAHDPILDRLGNDWIPAVRIPPARLIADPNGLVDATFQVTDDLAASELSAYAMFTRAVGLMRTESAADHAESRILFNRLRAEFPDHPLATRSLLAQAKWELQNDRVALALEILAIARSSSTLRELSGEAAFLEARTAYQNGDSQRAVQLFDEAAKSLSEKALDAAKLNSALIRVTRGGETTTVAQTDLPTDPGIRVNLELERALSEATPAKRRKSLEDFLTAHPDHARAAEARLAAAECALSGPETDLSFARAQLDTLNAEPEKAAGLSKSRLALVKLHIEDLSNDSTHAIATAKAILESYPDDPAAADASLVLGRNLFQSQNYNDARIAFEKLAASDSKNPERAQAAWLLAARSAALVSTIQSKQDALILFDNAIKARGALSSIARLEKARLLIDMNRLPEVIEPLGKWFSTLPDSDPLHFPVGFLLGEAISKQGSARPNSLAEALAVYDKLLAHADQQSLYYNRIQYLRGRSLEQMPDPKDPTRKREREALSAFYSVLEANSAPAEWDDFENCGFSALRLLRNAGRWPAAVACARRIASFNGPRAKEASEIASKIQLEHMIWED